jgi:DNA polymerase-4
LSSLNRPTCRRFSPRSVGRIWGVGKVTGHAFERLGIHTIGELRNLSLDSLNQIFGSSGEHYWRLARGMDDRPVVPDREARSLSHETTFPEDIADVEILRGLLVGFVEQVARRLRRHDLKGRTAELKVRFADFTTISRSLTLPEPTHATQELLAAGLELLTNRLPPRHLPVRLLGFGVSHLDASGTTQQHLFDQPQRERHRELDCVADQITAKFGKQAIRRGARLGRRLE